MNTTTQTLTTPTLLIPTTPLFKSLIRVKCQMSILITRAPDRHESCPPHQPPLSLLLQRGISRTTRTSHSSLRRMWTHTCIWPLSVIIQNYYSQRAHSMLGARSVQKHRTLKGTYSHTIRVTILLLTLQKLLLLAVDKSVCVVEYTL